MRVVYISSQFVEKVKPAGVIQMLYTAREFQKKLGNSFLLVIRGVRDKDVMKREEITYIESGCPFRARIVYYIFWLPIFFVRHRAIFQDSVVLYCVDWHVAIAAIMYKKIFRLKIAIEYHDPPYGTRKDFLIARFCDYLIATTSAMRSYLENVNVNAKDRICVVPNGIDLERFSSVPSKYECREIVKLPQDKKIILYSGNFVERKGIYVLADSVLCFNTEKKNDSLIVLVGSTDDNATKEFRERVRGQKNVLVAGYKPHEEIPLWIGSADVVVAPNSAKPKTFQDESAIKWTSPMKVFEYMAGKRPIVCSDIPAMRELLDENTAIFVEPDNPRALADGIERALNDKENSNRLVENAFKAVQEYAWDKRAEKVLNILNT